MTGTYKWDWSIFLQPVSTGEPATYLDWLLAGLQTTVILALASSVIALFLGLAMGILRCAPNRWLSSIGAVYVAFFRNVPVIVQLFAWYFVVPEILPTSIGTWIKQLPSMTQMMVLSTMCLGLYMAARVCEHIRAALGALPRGQLLAATALGLTRSQGYRYVLMPVALRVAIPPLTSELINVFKNSAVVSTIGLLDLSAQSQQLAEYTAQPYESFLAGTLVYIVINLIVMIVMHRVERRVQLHGYIGSK
jgi:glutamate/aspartate transport system permease protein